MAAILNVVVRVSLIQDSGLEERLEDERWFTGVQGTSLPGSWDKGYLSEADLAVWRPSKETVLPRQEEGGEEIGRERQCGGCSDHRGPHRPPELGLWL